MHAEGHFVLRDAGLNFRVVKFLMMDLIQGANVVERFAAKITADSFRVIEVKNRILTGAKADPLVL